MILLRVFRFIPKQWCILLGFVVAVSTAIWPAGASRGAARREEDQTGATVLEFVQPSPPATPFTAPPPSLSGKRFAVERATAEVAPSEEDPAPAPMLWDGQPRPRSKPNEAGLPLDSPSESLPNSRSFPNDPRTRCAPGCPGEGPLQYLDEPPRFPKRLGVMGEPLAGESWLTRPFGASVLMGVMWGDELVGGLIDQEAGLSGSIRLGWDYDAYWGCETRFGFATLGLNDTQGHAYEVRGDVLMWDLNLLYYPWGDNRWRPYFTVGLGLGNFDFEDNQLEWFNKSVLNIPLGLGLKYRFGSRMIWRVEVADNIAMGSSSGLENMHNWTFLGGVEIRFGGSRRSYWPWNPGKNLW
jgi:hypothetical protein